MITPTQQQLAETIVALSKVEKNTEEYLRLSRERRRVLREQQDMAWKQYQESQGRSQPKL